MKLVSTDIESLLSEFDLL